MRPDALTIRGGGAPAPAQLAALTAALAAWTDSARRPPADPTPPAYRSRWRRAALIESSEVPTYLKDDTTPWGAH